MKLARILAVVSAAVILGPSVFAQAPAPAPAPAQPAQAQSMTQQQVNEEILQELRTIRMLLQKMSAQTPAPQLQPQAPQPVSASLTNLKGYLMGRPDAPLTMVEFTDLQCPFCRQYVSTTFEQIKKNWIDTGKLRYISRDFPLEFHPQALPAARAARCAGEQGKFWEMRTTLMRNANLLSPDYITRTAADLKLDTKAFAACTASNKFDAEIQAETLEGVKIGVGGTPSFVIGRTAPNSLDGPLIVGAQSYASFDARLKALDAAK
jgi:protein-disulfide isomerase